MLAFKAIQLVLVLDASRAPTGRTWALNRAKERRGFARASTDATQDQNWHSGFVAHTSGSMASKNHAIIADSN